MGQHFSPTPGFIPIDVDLVFEPASKEHRKRSLSASSPLALVAPNCAAPPNKLPETPSPGLVPASDIKITGGEIDHVAAIVSFLVWRGHRIERARSIAEVAVALSGLKNKRGRPRKGPRLFPRGKMIYMTDGWDEESTNFAIVEGENFMFNVGANARLAEHVEKRVRKILGLVLKRDVLVSEMFAAWIMHHKPGSRPDALDAERHSRVVNDLSHLEDFMGTATLHDVGWSTGKQYLEFASAQAIKSQSANLEDPADIRCVARTTARSHIVTFVMVQRWYCDQSQIDHTAVHIPRVPRTAVDYLPLEHIVRLISACRGRIYDEDGRIVGHHEKRARYECVERFILIYFYGGTRHNNILLLTHGWDLLYGHINVKLGIIERQGPSAPITNKRRDASVLQGSLLELASGWEARDEAMRAKHPGRYVHIIHDEHGDPIADIKERDPLKAGKRMGHLFREVRMLAGLPDAKPHQLKHSGVTYAALAGMPVNAIEQAFSTSYTTLYAYYRNLRPTFDGLTPNCQKIYDPASFKLLALRRLIPPTRKKLLAKAA